MKQITLNEFKLRALKIQAKHGKTKKIRDRAKQALNPKIVSKTKPIKPKWKNYGEYLKSRKWKKKRERILKMFNYRCFHCLEPAYFVHHTKYSDWGKEKLEDLIPVCDKCHKLIHNL